ncbi:ribbon-helix-helix protein, CopG family [Caulobacter sp. 602-1]|uniref:ribbon-helix-helix protein, CopG family n=1 Tax=Caulobacter sp. 602-1 TaxID=2492472 RepID=UPI000F63028D|nr:ribbon-helix-helix protein, CopG family [Caulobacter sp. 602-1]RRN64684.1 ribbon-helix-helix protein, CopG family [Caulobacter sp. 602-1]
MSKSVLSLRIDDDELLKLSEIARYLGISRSELTQTIVSQFLAKADLSMSIEQVKNLRGATRRGAS